MPLTTVRNIPRIMTALGWNKAADLLNNWFNGASHTKTSTITAAEYSSAYNFGPLTAWLLGQAEGKFAWDKIFTRQLWKSNNNNDGDAISKLGRLLSNEGILKPGIKDVKFGYKTYTAADYEKNKAYLNASSFNTNPTTPLTHCVAALGSFNLKIALNGTVSHTPGRFFDNYYTVTPDSIDVYLWDSFDFVDDGMISQPLGFWDEVTNTVSKTPGSGLTYVNNSSFRDWRTANGMGGDFYLYSEVLRHKFNEPANLQPFEISKP